jgi:two-component sensor histidine kinase
MEGDETNKAGRIEQAMHHNLPNNVHVISTTTNIATPNISDKRNEKIKEFQATSLFPI